MHALLTYFSMSGNTSYEPFIARWLRRAESAGFCLPVSILTDLDTDADHHGVPVVRADWREHQDVVRAGNHFDRKSALICAALPSLPPCVIFDLDTDIALNPTEELLAYWYEPFAMPPDSGKRTIPWKDERGQFIREHSSSVMVFGQPENEGVRHAIVDNYRCAWNWLRENSTGLPKWLDAIREQRAWSLLHYWAKAPLMPETLNWSGSHYPPNPAAKIVHYHGGSKHTLLFP